MAAHFLSLRRFRAYDGYLVCYGSDFAEHLYQSAILLVGEVYRTADFRLVGNGVAIDVVGDVERTVDALRYNFVGVEFARYGNLERLRHDVHFRQYARNGFAGTCRGGIEEQLFRIEILDFAVAGQFEVRTFQ